MRNKLKSTKTTIICCIFIGILLVGLSVYVAFLDSEGNFHKNEEKPVTKNPTPTQVVLPSTGDTQATVLIVAAEHARNMIRVYEPVQDACFDLFYTGTTDIRDRFDAVIAGTQVDVAAIATVSYDAESGRLYSLRQTEADWCYEMQSRVEINTEKGMLTVAGNHYRVAENIIVMAEGERITLSELASVDELTIKGMGDRVFLIERVKGHGTLELQAVDAFVGGSFYIDGKKAEDISGDMSMTVREGEYRFALENGNLYAETSLTIEKGAVAQWNLSEYLPQEPQYGRVEFLLEPADAQLYIDNKLQDNSAFAELEYGEHVVGLYKDGYVGWTGKITVSSEEMVFTVSLVPEPVATPTPTHVEVTPTPEISATPTPTVPEEGEEELRETEETETVSVQIIWYPTSVVSVDSVYVGTTDAGGVLTTELRYGTHVVELTRIQLDGSTVPKKCTVDVTAQTTVLNFLLTD